jgi:hypothetical protein
MLATAANAPPPSRVLPPFSTRSGAARRGQRSLGVGQRHKSAANPEQEQRAAPFIARPGAIPHAGGGAKAFNPVGERGGPTIGRRVGGAFATTSRPIAPNCWRPIFESWVCLWRWGNGQRVWAGPQSAHGGRGQRVGSGRLAHLTRVGGRRGWRGSTARVHRPIVQQAAWPAHPRRSPRVPFEEGGPVRSVSGVARNFADRRWRGRQSARWSNRGCGQKKSRSGRRCG